MQPYTFRLDVWPVTISIDEFENRMMKALSHFSKYAIAYEISEEVSKPHYQGVIFSDMKRETLKKKMDSYFPEWCGTRGSGSGSRRSFAPVKELEKYLSYVFKDDCIVYIADFSADEIASIPKWKKNLKKKEEEKDLSWFEKLKLHCRERACNLSSNGWEFAAAIIDAYRLYAKCEPNDFQIKSYAKSIQRDFVYDYAVRNDQPYVYESYLRARANEVIGPTWVHVQLPSLIKKAAKEISDILDEVDIDKIDSGELFSAD